MKTCVIAAVSWLVVAAGEVRSGDSALQAYERYALQHAGDAARGRRLFFGERARCSVCHRVGGKGGDVGKDLSSIGGKFGRPHLIESLLQPSQQIVEGYRTNVIETVEGRILTGIVKSENGQRIVLADEQGNRHVVRLADVQRRRISSVSLMPQGLERQLTREEFTDLIAFLETLGTGNVKRGGDVKGAISLPAGFAVEIVATGLDGLTALDVLPDGRVLVCEQEGRVRVIREGKLLEDPLVSLPVDANWERGLIGVTHHPRFPRQPYVYVCWVAKDPYPHHRVSRFTVRGDTVIAGSEKVLLTGDDQTKMGGSVPAGHQGGALHFGIDGKLYIAIGEQTAGIPAQRLDTLLGKILRIDADGSIPSDNPFFSSVQGKYRAIWARGCRNPFTFAVRKSDGLMLINDVGGQREEINVGRSGANYGWPVAEHGDLAAHRSGGFDRPLYWYPQSSINGGDFCPRSARSWSGRWRSRYFFADFQHGWIKTLDPKRPSVATTFAGGIRQPVDLRFSDNGSLYVLSRNAWVIDRKYVGGTGAVLKIDPVATAK